MKKISPKQLMTKLNNESICILDVRSKEKFQNGHLKHKNAQNINIFKKDIFDLEVSMEEGKLPLPKDQEIILTCTTGNSASKCATILSKKGYDVTLLKGGMSAWNKETE